MKRFAKYWVLLFLPGLAGLFSCKKDEPKPATPNYDIQVNLSYAVDSTALKTDTLLYTNKAGNPFGVWHLEYYLSGFSLQDINGNWHNTGNIYYVNTKMAQTNAFALQGLRQGQYQKLKFYIGVPPEKNLTGTLPATPENLNMAWPDMMGGGYHFLKLEGYFKDAANAQQGFAIHLGRSENLITAEMPLNINLTGNTTLKLQMNVNEWFCNPHTYNFNIQGNYTMGVDSLMNKLKQNGSDVFKTIP